MSSTPPRRRTVVLIGKTGDGKSTLANMLTTGAVDGAFAAGNSYSSVTKQTIARDSTCGTWTVIDAVGLFATDTAHHDLARTRELRNFLAENHPSIDAFCYVKKASKFIRADEQCWRAFHTLFEDIGVDRQYRDHVLLVFTSCSRKEWLDENRSFIEQMMAPPGRRDRIRLGEDTLPMFAEGNPYKSVAVDFAPHDSDAEVEGKLEVTRVVNLEALKSAIGEVEQPLELHKRPPRGVAEWSKCGLKIVGVVCINIVAGFICYYYVDSWHTKKRLL